ncbi:MAG: type II toxin-antitoxin system VapC family toxin [Acidobacteria bacterium]|nr:type II toxin-antitoxin system VapC family toxin [Acidobacteriota bacterium]MBI3427095.1 type II toxin-antitoxin system VapC family toxin [Acidobacteriota bacterium]
MSQPTPATSAGAVVIDANILVAICAKEPGEPTAKAALADYTARNWAFYAPGAILTEVLFIRCRKLQSGEIDAAKHRKAVEDFNDYMSAIMPSPQGDIRFILRNEEIRSGYSCLHSADAFYLALAEDLAQSGPAEFLTFDKRVVNVAANNAPAVRVNLLPS